MNRQGRQIGQAGQCRVIGQAQADDPLYFAGHGVVREDRRDIAVFLGGNHRPGLVRPLHVDREQAGPLTPNHPLEPTGGRRWLAVLLRVGRLVFVVDYQLVNRNRRGNHALGNRGIDLPARKTRRAAILRTKYPRRQNAEFVLDALGVAYDDWNRIVEKLVMLNESGVPCSDSRDPAWARELAKASGPIRTMIEDAAALDSVVLIAVIDGVERALLSCGGTMSADKKAKAVAMLYRAFKASGMVDPAMIEEAVKLATD